MSDLCQYEWLSRHDCATGHTRLLQTEHEVALLAGSMSMYLLSRGCPRSVVACIGTGLPSSVAETSCAPTAAYTLTRVRFCPGGYGFVGLSALVNAYADSPDVGAPLCRVTVMVDARRPAYTQLRCKSRSGRGSSRVCRRPRC